MIRHNPNGRGHPYLLDADQRVPADPIAGSPIELRALTGRDVEAVSVELERNGESVAVAAVRRPPEGTETPPYAGARLREREETHLSAAAQGRVDGEHIGWVAEIDTRPGERELRYRFVTSSDATDWFHVELASWQRERGELVVDAGDLQERVLADTVTWLATARGVHRARFALRLDAHEHVVGFGERFDALDQRGRSLDCVVFEQYTAQGGRTYLPVPFAHVVGRAGWGFHVATSRRTWFDVGADDSDRLWVEVELDPEASPSAALELYAGTPAEVLAAFLRRTGRPKLPPEWIFQPWMSANEWNTQERALREVARGERERIPAGVLVLEAWSDEQTFVAFRDAQYEPHPDGAPHDLGDFSFPAGGAWPDPKGFVDDLHARGMRVLLWQIPLVRADPPPGSQAAFDEQVLVERGYTVREEDGSPYRNRGWWFPNAVLPDFTNEDATAWWLAKRRYLLDEIGVDGFKTDGGEHLWGAALRYADGTRGRETNNRYPVLYASAYHRLFEESGHDAITFSRAGFTGSASAPCHWAGDEESSWEAFRASLIAGLTAGASGIFFWGWDLGGFSGEVPSAELYLRSAAAACFCPIMQYHSEFNHHREPSRDRTPWNIAERTGDERVIPVYRRFARLRQALVPYLAEQARRTVEDGRPLMRALFFETNDERIWDAPLQYFLGDDLLVAPVTEPGASAWSVFAPEGEWIDAWRGEHVTGPGTRARSAPLDEVPVLVRAEAAERFLPIFDAVR